MMFPQRYYNLNLDPYRSYEICKGIFKLPFKKQCW